MKETRVTCRNEEEVIKVLEIAEKEGYTWDNNVKATNYKPSASYPYDLVMRKCLCWCVFGGKEPCAARDFINSYNTDHTEPCEVSQKVKNKIILDFMKKWHEIREGCDERSCYNCKFNGDEYGDTSCNLDDVDDTADEETFLEAVNLLIDVVASGDACTWKLTPDEAIEVLEEEIKKSKDMKDTDVQNRVAALEMAVRALEEKK